MSVSMLPSLSGTAIPLSSTRAAQGASGASAKAASDVDATDRQVRDSEQVVVQRKTDADRKAAVAEQAADDLKVAKAAMARDQAALAQAKSRALLDVYT